MWLKIHQRRHLADLTQELLLLSLKWRAGFSPHFSKPKIPTRMKINHSILCFSQATTHFGLGILYNPHLCSSKQCIFFLLGGGGKKRLLTFKNSCRHVSAPVCAHTLVRTCANTRNKRASLLCAGMKEQEATRMYVTMHRLPNDKRNRALANASPSLFHAYKPITPCSLRERFNFCSAEAKSFPAHSPGRVCRQAESISMGMEVFKKCLQVPQPEQT